LRTVPLNDLAFRDISASAIVSVQEPGDFVGLESDRSRLAAAGLSGHRGLRASARSCGAPAPLAGAECLIFQRSPCLRASCVVRRRAQNDPERRPRSIDCR